MDHAFVGDDDRVPVSGLVVILLRCDAFAVVERQLVYIIYIGTDKRMGLPFVEGVTFGFQDGFVQRIMIAGRSGGVLVGDVVETDRADLHVHRRPFGDGGSGQVVHIPEVFELVGGSGDRPLQRAARTRTGAFAVTDHDCVAVGRVGIVVSLDGLVAVHVIQGQFGDGVYVGSLFGMGLPVVEVVTFGLQRRVHAVVVLGRGHGVFDRPAFEVDALMSDGTDLDEDRSAVIHRSG